MDRAVAATGRNGGRATPPFSIIISVATWRSATFQNYCYPTISLPEKNWAISFAAVSGASEPWTEFSPIDLA